MLDAWANVKGVSGAHWQKLVKTWVALESHYGFSNPRNVALGGPGRPSGIAWWKSRARPAERLPPDCADVAAFAQSWWTWWKSINPVWRPKTDDGMLLCEGTGDWDILGNCAGLNGMLSVIVCLRWWSLAAKGNAGDDWLAAVDDVVWVMEQIMASG
ncbi:hypothetical protein C8J56DRAFT_779529 [Mycena floridula]|nr:hypothetical protein C8J56DRAFT_779529 [Mycena floridula]